MTLVLAQGRRSEAGTIARVSASEVEPIVVDALRAVYPDDADLGDRALIEARAERVLLRAESILIHADSDDQRPGEPGRACSPAPSAAPCRARPHILKSGRERASPICPRRRLSVT